MPRTDYPANRGPLDRTEYVDRGVDPFSCVAGCLGATLSLVVLLCTVALIVKALLGWW
jgi:hypothetical protein